MSKYANPKTGELYEDGDVIDLQEPTRVDLDIDGEEPAGYSQKIMKNALRGKEGLELDALKACRRKTGCFGSTAERTEWRRITARTLRNDTDSILYKAWIKFKIEQYKLINSKPGQVRTFPQLMAGIRNEIASKDWIMQNRETVLASMRKSIMAAAEDDIYEN